MRYCNSLLQLSHVKRNLPRRTIFLWYFGILCPSGNCTLRLLPWWPLLFRSEFRAQNTAEDRMSDRSVGSRIYNLRRIKFEKEQRKHRHVQHRLLSTFLTNVRCIRNKMDESFLCISDLTPDILIFCESWLLASWLCLKIPGYRPTAVRNDRNTYGGGIISYFANTCPYYSHLSAKQTTPVFFGLMMIKPKFEMLKRKL